jgi:hypothetical protein
MILEELMSFSVFFATKALSRKDYFFARKDAKARNKLLLFGL